MRPIATNGSCSDTSERERSAIEPPIRQRRAVTALGVDKRNERRPVSVQRHDGLFRVPRHALLLGIVNGALAVVPMHPDDRADNLIDG